MTGPARPGACAALLVGALTSPLAGQAPARPDDGPREESLTVDACLTAPVEQLRFVVSAGLGRIFPIRQTHDAAMVILAEPGVTGATCPTLRLDLSLKAREESPGADGRPGVVLSGTAHVKARFLGAVRFKRGAGGAAATAAGLREASLCLREVDSVELDLPGAPLWLTPAWLRGWLADALTGRACSDITSLVYVFLERGGTLTPLR